jgi:hypothetical protein
MARQTKKARAYLKGRAWRPDLSRASAYYPLDSPSKGCKVDRLLLFTVRVGALALLAVGWSRMERALHADELATTVLFVPLVFLAVAFWRATAR